MTKKVPAHYQTLAELFPNIDRSTRWRWRRDGKVRKCDEVINGVEYWRSDVPITPPDAAPPARRVPSPKSAVGRKMAAAAARRAAKAASEAEQPAPSDA